MKYIIKCWSGTRILNYKGVFELNCFVAVPMTFETWDDAFEYCDLNSIDLNEFVVAWNDHETN